MKLVQIENGTHGAVLGSQVGLADNWWLRLRGLLGRPPLKAGEGLLLSPCKAVHMYGMRYPLDVVFLDRSGRVVAAYHSLAPGKRTRFHRTAYHTLELPAGTLKATATCEGDILVTASTEELFVS